jgi:hypothetical protein
MAIQSQLGRFQSLMLRGERAACGQPQCTPTQKPQRGLCTCTCMHARGWVMDWTHNSTCALWLIASHVQHTDQQSQPLQLELVLVVVFKNMFNPVMQLFCWGARHYCGSDTLKCLMLATCMFLLKLGTIKRVLFIWIHIIYVVVESQPRLCTLDAGLHRTKLVGYVLPYNSCLNVLC